MEIIGSFILAIAQSILFYGKEIGISMLLFLSLGNGILYYILKKKDKIRNKNGFWLILPILLLGSTYFLFANSIFYMANIFVLLGLSLIMYVIVTNKKNCLKNHICHTGKLVVDTLIGYEEGIQYTKEKSKISNHKIDKHKVRKIAISLLLVSIIVGIILILLASADSIFANLFSGVGNLFQNINMGSIFDFIIRIAIILGIYFLILGFILKIQRQYEEEKVVKTKVYKDMFIIKLLLILLNIVYFVFCFIQIKSLFVSINVETTFDYANYARSGFFQLMFVSLINFVIILISNQYNIKKEKMIKILNICLIIFTMIIAFSSMYRMHRYQMEYSLTYLRMFVYIILVTEISLLIPIIVYMINEKFKVVKWSFIIIVCIYCGINYIQIEKLIVDKNVNKKTSTIATDYNYIARIASEDSYEILEEKQKENIKASEKLEVTRILLQLSSNTKEMSWQEFNLSKWKMQEKNIEKQKLREEIAKLEREVRQEKMTEEISTKPQNYIYNEAMNENEEYFVEILDSTTGTDIWSITKITEKGEKFTQINKITVPSSSKIKFFGNGLGFLEKPDNIYCAKSELLVTYDSGKTFNKINFPKGVFTLSDAKGEEWENCYDYFYLPTKDENGNLIVLASGGYEGGYNQGKTRAKYISKNKGYSWEFVEEIYKEDI